MWQCQYENTVHAKGVSLPTSWFLSPSATLSPSASAYALGQIGTQAVFLTRKPRLRPIADPRLWPDAKVKIYGRARQRFSREPFFFSSIFLFPVPILTVCKQTHSSLQTAASRITPHKPSSAGAAEVAGGS